MRSLVRGGWLLLIAPLCLPAQRMASTYTDLQAFLDSCPENDPYSPMIRRDFQILRDLAAAGDIPCTEPYTQMPVSQITDELSVIQTLRFIYYMDMGQSEYLPWTPFRLYDWMKSRIAGINIDSSLSGAAGECCLIINGREYIDVGVIADDANRQYRQTADGQGAQAGFFSHETRHTEGTRYLHVSGCGIPGGCDPTYDVTNLSAYAIQYYLAAQMMSGAINLGYSCDAGTRMSLGSAFEQLANVYPGRFVTNPPPILSLPANPGGPCLAAGTFTVTTPVPAEFSSAGGNFTVSITASNPNAGWTTDSTVDWIIPIAGINSTGSGQAGFAVATNPAISPRNGSVVVAGQTVSINQAGCASMCVSAVSITSVVSSVPYVTTISGGSWVTIYGSNLSATKREWGSADFTGDRLPLSLDGVSVRIDGLPAAISYISPTQINVQCPDDGATGPIQIPVQVTNSQGTAMGTATFASYEPAFFGFSGTVVSQGAGTTAMYVAALHLDATLVAPVGYFGPSVASHPAAPGETISLYGTGFGATNPPTGSGVLLHTAAPLAGVNPLTITIGGQDATVDFAGLSQAGLYQFNLVVPLVADGDQPLTGGASNVFLAVQH